MKTNMTSRSSKRGFTLVEMIGVLAIIAVLAALLIPRIFQAINEARVNSAAVSYSTIKSAAMGYYGKFGRFGDIDGSALQLTAPGANPGDPDVPGAGAGKAADWADLVLLPAGFIEKPLETKIGDDARLEIVPAEIATVAATAANSAYNLDGIATVENEASAGALVLQMVLTGVAEDDAKSLNDKIDGANFGSAIGADDVVGRVKYAAGSPTTVRIYVAHK